MSVISSKELFILGRISLRPTHGHEIMTTLRASHADLWVELSEKHVYYVLRKLEREGFIQSAEKREGGAPARKVYAITQTGRLALSGMLVSESLIEAIPYSEFDVVFGMLCYTDALTPAKKSEVLDRRRAVLEQLVADLKVTASGSLDSGAPRIMLEKVTRNVSNELAWLGEVAAIVQRDGWDSMKPTFAQYSPTPTRKDVSL